MSFEIVSEEGFPDYEVWTCEICGESICLAGVGGDVADCPTCLEAEMEAEVQEHDEPEHEWDANMNPVNKEAR